MDSRFSSEIASAFATKGEDSLDGQNITTSTIGFTDANTDEAALSFYTQEHERHRRGTSISGVVPLVYTTVPFYLHVSGVNWATPTLLRPPRLQARLQVEQLDGCGTVVKTRTHETELVIGESSPAFTSALEMPAQTGPNSQAIAQLTLITVTPRSRGRDLRSARFVLAALLWNGAATALLPNHASVRLDVRQGICGPSDMQGNGGVAAVALHRDDSMARTAGEAASSASMHSHLGVARGRGEICVTTTLPRVLRRGGTRVALSAAGARGGGWARLCAVDARGGAAAVEVSVPRGSLPGGKMRVEVLSRRAGVVRRAGFAQLRVGHGQSARGEIEWRACRGAGSASVGGARIGGWRERGHDVEIDIVLGESADKARGGKKGEIGSSVQFPEAESAD